MDHARSDAVDVLGISDDVRRNNYANLAALAVLLYDHMLTFPAEVDYIWSKPLRFSSFWFLAFRYFALFGNVAITAIDYIFTNDRQCNYYHILHHAFMFVVQVFIGVILIMRTYALYRRDNRVLAALLTVGAGLIGVSIWAVTGQEDTLSVTPGEGCQLGYDRATSLHIAVPWESQLALDTLVFALTFLKTYHPVLRSHTLPSAAPSGSMRGRRYIYHVLLRDGALYYGCMCIANFSNVLTFYISGPVFRGGLSTLASSISALMISRLVFNLHETAAPDDGPDSDATTHGGPVHGARSGLVFAMSAIASQQCHSQSGTGSGSGMEMETDTEDITSSLRFETLPPSTRDRTGTVGTASAWSYRAVLADVEQEPREQRTTTGSDVV